MDMANHCPLAFSIDMDKRHQKVTVGYRGTLWY
jgi:hypothetical protein